MYCKHCGAALPENAVFCPSCGQAVAGKAPEPVRAPEPVTPPDVSPGPPVGRIGYSDRIRDPAFARYVKNSNRWAAIFSLVIALAAVIGFTVAGERGAEGMENPQAMYIGFGIGGMFLLIAFFQILGRKRSRTWDGVVADKTVKKKERRQRLDDGDVYVQEYWEYVVLIREDGGKTHRLVTENDDTVYKYYRVGDRVRHHAGLNSYEKYDKSRDSVIFCAACSTLCDISEDCCPRCKCPLLK